MMAMILTTIVTQAEVMTLLYCLYSFSNATPDVVYRHFLLLITRAGFILAFTMTTFFTFNVKHIFLSWQVDSGVFV